MRRASGSPEAQPNPGRAASSVNMSVGAQRSRWSELLSRQYRGRTAVVWTLWTTAYFITNGLNNWMPTLYNRAYHLTLQQSLRAGTLTNVAQVALLLVCYAVEKVFHTLIGGNSFVFRHHSLLAGLLISASGTKLVVDWGHGSTTEGRLARRAAQTRLGLEA